MPNTWSARLYITLIALAGAAAFAVSLAHPVLNDQARFVALLVVAVITSRLKVKLPGKKANMSVSLPFLLLASAQLQLLPTLLVALAATVVQSIPRELSRVKLVQMLFNVSTVLLAITSAYGVQHQARFGSPYSLLPLLLGAAVYLLVNTALVAGIVCLSSEQGLGKTWTGIFALTYLYYVLSAGIAAVILGFGIRWSVLLLTLVVVYGAYRSFQLYFVAMSSALAPQMASAGD
ncbi:MAG: hypothetical protein WA188_06755 [Terriglobales bacterium]